MSVGIVAFLCFLPLFLFIAALVYGLVRKLKRDNAIIAQAKQHRASASPSGTPQGLVCDQCGHKFADWEKPRVCHERVVCALCLSKLSSDAAATSLKTMPYVIAAGALLLIAVACIRGCN
jgi:uncharacterized paraquat-inducible protein A